MISPRRLVNGSALTATIATYYTTPVASTATAKQLLVCNTDGISHAFTYHVVPNGGTASVANTLFNTVSLQPYETKIFGLTDVMPVGFTIQAFADTTDVVSMTVSGMENT